MISIRVPSVNNKFGFGKLVDTFGNELMNATGTDWRGFRYEVTSGTWSVETSLPAPRYNAGTYLHLQC